MVVGSFWGNASLGNATEQMPRDVLIQTTTALTSLDDTLILGTTIIYASVFDENVM